MTNTIDKYWTAFYTKPRNEKKVAERLKSKGYEVYCPTRTVLKQWSDRKKKVVEPVFTSYLFARVDEAQRLEITEDLGIVSNVRWLGKPAVIRNSEIEEIRSFLDEYQNVRISSKEISIGDHIEVDGGALSGITGVVKRTKGNKVFMSISSLGIEMIAEISMRHIRD